VRAGTASSGSGSPQFRRLCLVGNITETLQGRVTGGAERQMELLSKALAGRGHQVTCVAPGFSGPEQSVDGVRVVSGWQPDRGIRALRYATYRLPELARVLTEVGAEVYYARGYSLYAPAVMGVARRRGALGLLGISSNTDLTHSGRPTAHGASGPYGALLNGRIAWRYFRRRGLLKAWRVIVQNEEQAARCRALRIPFQVIPNILEPAGTGDAGAEAGQDAGPDAAWVGALSLWKGVDKLLDLARCSPDVRFSIIGPLAAPELAPVLSMLRSLPNVQWLGELGHGETLGVMARSRLVVNTSPAEGFSNVFLEAWSLGKPVVSLAADPDGLLSGERRLGHCAKGSLGDMSSAIHALLENGAKRAATGARAKSYVKERHLPEAVCAEYERLIEQGLDEIRSGGKP
jgi:glycosyltransferase involved in cell wall biosynthesis